jgi:predicted ATPase
MQVAVTSFVGRRREIGAVKRLVASQRLVTLSGSGGVGKTRLAVAVAGQLISDCQDGVFVVELAGVQDASVLPHTAAAALGLRDESGRPVADHLAGIAFGGQPSGPRAWRANVRFGSSYISCI